MYLWSNMFFLTHIMLWSIFFLSYTFAKFFPMVASGQFFVAMWTTKKISCILGQILFPDKLGTWTTELGGKVTMATMT